MCAKALDPLPSGVTIELKDLVVQRFENEILHDVNLTLRQGDIVYLTGPVGSGKSSLLEVLYGELRPGSGSANVLGYNLSRIKSRKRQEMRRKMGIVFQSMGQLLYDRTVYQNLDFVLRSTTKLKKAERRLRIAKGLESVEMCTKGYKYPHELSGGEAARISIARALIVEPQLILMDEPTTGLDNDTTLAIGTLIHQIAKGGTSILLTTHNRYMIKHLPATTYRIDPEKRTLSEVKYFDESTQDEDHEDH